MIPLIADKYAASDWPESCENRRPAVAFQLARPLEWDFPGDMEEEEGRG